MNRLKVFRNSWTIFAFLMILYRPEYVLHYRIIDITFNILRVVVSIFLGLQYLKMKRFSKVFLWELLIWGGYNVFCIFNHTWSRSVFIELIIILSVTFLVEICVEKGDVLFFEKALHKLLLFYAICNTITILNGNVKEDLFLGFDNDISMRLIPLLGVMFFLSIKLYGHLIRIDYLIILIYIFDFAATRSTTALICLVMFFLCVICNKFIRISSKFVILLSLLIFISLYYIRIHYLFKWILVDILHKDLSLAYRLYIWESVLEALKSSPIWGFGQYMLNSTYYNIAYPMYEASIQSHNFLLHIYASGGFLGLFFIILFITKCFKVVDAHAGKRLCYILVITLFIYLLCGTFASYYGIEYFVLLLVVSSSRKLLLGEIK